ncbi:hypothetical protein VNO77_23106 [Canavalia gladiata]|uniref:Uncharacterized protein n=1 Tax=Canavalia gladiata TaxID=3824 RepID=A0AAN9L4R8_CANGL
MPLGVAAALHGFNIGSIWLIFPFRSPVSPWLPERGQAPGDAHCPIIETLSFFKLWTLSEGQIGPGFGLCTRYTCSTSCTIHQPGYRSAHPGAKVVCHKARSLSLLKALLEPSTLALSENSTWTHQSCLVRARRPFPCFVADPVTAIVAADLVTPLRLYGSRTSRISGLSSRVTDLGHHVRRLTRSLPSYDAHDLNARIAFAFS